jgi:hypothetical protein
MRYWNIARQRHYHSGKKLADLPLEKPSSQPTLRWRGVDSNHQFRECRHRCPHVDFSVEAAEPVDLVGDWALTFAAAGCDLVRLPKLIGAT